MARRIPFRNFLASSPLMAGVDQESMLAATRVIRPRPFRQGEALFTPGDGGREMFLVLAGTVRIELPCDELRAPMALLGPGELAGVTTFFDARTPRYCWAVGAERGLAAMIPPVVYVEAARLGHPVARNIEQLALQTLLKRDRLSQRRYAELSGAAPPPRWQRA